MIFKITVIALDGSKAVRMFDNREDFEYEYANYCSFGYDCHEYSAYSNFAIVRAQEGA